MKLMTGLILGLSVFIFHTQAHANGCFGGDKQDGISTRQEHHPCSTAGSCMGFGFNAATGVSENYYGLHPLCPGEQTRTVTTYHCMDENGAGYAFEDAEPWGICQVH